MRSHRRQSSNDSVLRCAPTCRWTCPRTGPGQGVSVASEAALGAAWRVAVPSAPRSGDGAYRRRRCPAPVHDGRLRRRVLLERVRRWTIRSLSCRAGPGLFQPSPDNVRFGEEGRLTPSGRDLEEDGPVDKDKRMTEAWATWRLQGQCDDPEELHHKLWLEADA